MSSEDSGGPSPPPPTEPPPSLPPPLPARPTKAPPDQKPKHSETVQVAERTSNLVEPLDIDDDEVSQHMTQSYSEISFSRSPEIESEDLRALDLDSVEVAEQFSKRPVTLPCNKKIDKTLRPLDLDGTVHVEGNMLHFVAEDLESKIKLSSPVAKKTDASAGSRSGTPSTLYRQLLDPQLGQVDTAFINDLECEAHRMATSVDNLIENLSGILHSISSITADNVDIYKNAVAKMSDCMDGNIKSMYTMMAKAEEITQNMKGVEAQAAKIKEIKKLVDLFESFV